MHRSIRFQVLAACCFFILAGSAVIPYAGIQNDESLFLAPLYLKNPKEMSFNVFHHTIPLMVMTYIGTLKTLIYAPIVALFGASVWTLRLPTVIIGTLTVFFFFRLALRITSAQGAAIAGLLLATDPIFLLTNTIDWGPVALGHFLLVTGCLCLVRFAQDWPVRTDSMRYLALGFFLLGLGLWNKALFFWVLGGLGAGSVLFLPELKRLFTWKNARIAAAAFVLGSFPFLLYNVRHPNATLSASAHFDPVSLAMRKFASLTGTLDGSGLLGYFTTESWDVANPKTPATLHGRFAWWVEQKFGTHRHDGMNYAFAASLLLLPYWRRVRAAWFSLIFMAVTWALMAMTTNAGGAVHHAVLLWPFPHLFVALALASIRWKRVGAAVCGVLVVLDLLVIAKYIADYERNGPGPVYTDAFFRLSDALQDPPGHKEDHRLWVMDWGILNGILFTHQGRIAVRVGEPPFMTDNPGPADRKMIDYVMKDRDALFVGHVADREIMKGAARRLEAEAAAVGLRKEVLQTISDTNGRPVFEIYRLVSQ